MPTSDDKGRLPWRTGRKVGRTLYSQLGPMPSDDDPLIGLMDTTELARRVAAAVNAEGRAQEYARDCVALRAKVQQLDRDNEALLRTHAVENESLRRDAERYRLLRNPDNWTQDFLVVNEGETRFTHTEALDAAIDAARQQEPKP